VSSAAETRATSPVTLQFDGVDVRVDLARPVSLAIEQRFDTAQPRHFGAAPASSLPFVAGAFTGEVSSGASCNCRTLMLTPHCNGTHTEGVGHLLATAHDVLDVVPMGLLPALLLSVVPAAREESSEDSVPAPQPGDRLITRAAISAAWTAARAARLPWEPRALLLRTLPNPPEKRQRDYVARPAAYFTRQAMNDLLVRGIEHLVVDLPSVDRDHDEGRLTTHRLFFGLAAGSTRLEDAFRAQCTITELAWFEPALPDGPCALQLQVPAFGGDAVPSRPLYYALAAAQ
jgi:arylformamidase